MNALTQEQRIALVGTIKSCGVDAVLTELALYAEMKEETARVAQARIDGLAPDQWALIFNALDSTVEVLDGQVIAGGIGGNSDDDR